jgi:hypothetical protein
MVVNLASAVQARCHVELVPKHRSIRQIGMVLCVGCIVGAASVKGGLGLALGLLTVKSELAHLPPITLLGGHFGQNK